MLCIKIMPPVCIFCVDEWTSGADVRPPATTVSSSALLSLADLEEFSDVSVCKE